MIRQRLLSGLGALVFSMSCQPGVNFGQGIDGSDMEVSARVRLADYLKDSRYPDFSRPADGATPASAADWPGVSAKPARGLSMTGYAGAGLRKGSLELRVNLEVSETGRYSFFAVARDSGSNRPVATSTTTRDFAAGEHTVTLVFYGLAIGDGVRAVYADSDAPAQLVFEVAGVGAERVPNDAEIERMLSGELASTEGRLPYLKATFISESYELTRFTGQVWDSPEKRRRVAELEAEIEAESETEP